MRKRDRLRPRSPAVGTSALVLRVHFKTWCNRFSVSVKVTISHLGFLHFGSVLVSLRFPNGSLEMHSKSNCQAHSVIFLCHLPRLAHNARREPEPRGKVKPRP